MWAMLGITTSVVSLVYLIMVFVLFSLKKKNDTEENKVYKELILLNILSIIFEVILALLGNSFGVSEHLDQVYLVIARLFVCMVFLWSSTLLYYTIIVSKKMETKLVDRDKKNVKKRGLSRFYTIYSFVQIIVVFIVLNLDVDFFSSEEVKYTYGPANNFGFMLVFLCCFLMFIMVLKNWKRIKKEKAIPILILVALIFGSTALQKANPGLLLFNFSLSFVTILMYHTIENPDMKMIEQLEDARSQADKANRAKTDFLSSMSHEIRTPLNAIVGFSECIVDADSLESAKEDAKDIVMASNNLLEIVNGILDISKIEADKMEIVNTEYNLNEILENLTKLIKPRIGEKPIELETQFAPDIPNNLYGDAGKVKQIITNILTNAAKYTEEGMINFKVNCVNVGNTCKLVISISDTGRGIKESQMAKLFTKFERLDEDRNTTTEGTGLGLAITKRLVEMMGGKIVVQSEYGEGSTFTVYLKQEIRNSSKKEEKEVIKEVDVSGNRVLAVDDNKLNLKVIKKLLGDYNLDITLVESGFICLDKVKEEKYDLILMDIMMPKMGGLETLKRLKEIDGFSTPVVALTADAIQGKSDKYKEVGFNDYLAKPIDRDELKRVLYTYLKPNKNNDNPIKEEKVIEKKDNMDYKDNINNINYLKEKGIDVDSSIELLGDIDMYNSTLKDFIEESKSRVPKMKEFKNNGDCANYAILAHAMKSDSKYLGFKTLATLSLDHELKGKDNDIDFINANYDTLIQELNRVLCIVKNYLGE